MSTNPWQMFKLDSVREIEKRVHQCPQKVKMELYSIAITIYMKECRRFLSKNDPDQLENFLSNQYKLD
ncbi:hypothetical protein [Salicibibacter halophilus]|uniref:hypothetical protein n=1 Tax=Salicibibacter halophilus TaxID=2502791 RepID=UPI001D0478D2|nr:hypothetical protein [Salicibibacter halophilus]